jgi:hypothetical protein
LARLEKPDHLVSYSGLFDFDSFREKIKEGAKLEYLNIQDVLKQEKGLKSINGLR